MRTVSYSEARRNLASLLDLARREEVLIRRRNGDTFSLTYTKQPKSPLDIEPVKTNATMDDILEVIRESRERYG